MIVPTARTVFGASALLAASVLSTAGTVAAQANSPSGLTADTACNSNLCLNAIYDMSANRINYTMTTQQGGKQIGWYAVGTGSRMAGSDMMIGWVGTDGKPIMSQRTASGHRMPTTAITAQAAMPINARTFSNSTGTAWSWSSPVSSSSSLSPSAKTSFIWAVNGNSNPADDPSAAIREHTDYGVLNLDLTKAYTPPADGKAPPVTTTPATSNGQTGDASASSGGDGDEGSSKTYRLILAHLIFMTLAWMVVAPIAVLIGRYGRTTMKAWYPWHQNLQIGTLVLAIVGFGVIVYMVEDGGGGHFDNLHAKVGLSVFILAVLQGVLGITGHKTRRFNPIRIVHVVVGVVTMALAIWNVGLGYELWSEQHGTKASKYIIWGVGFGLFGGLWVLGLALLPKQLKTWKAEEQEKRGLPYQHDQPPTQYQDQQQHRRNRDDIRLLEKSQPPSLE